MPLGPGRVVYITKRLGCRGSLTSTGMSYTCLSQSDRLIVHMSGRTYAWLFALLVAMAFGFSLGWVMGTITPPTRHSSTTCLSFMN